MSFIAALPMYDWPETQAEIDMEWRRLRALLRRAGIDAPEMIVRRNADMPAVPGGIRDQGGAVIAPDPATLPPDELYRETLWRHPMLLLAQACWGPMELGLAEHVQVVGQPSYDGFEGGKGSLYSSAILMRAMKRDDVGRSPVAPPSVLPDISPTSGEIGPSSTISLVSNVDDWRNRGGSPISPLVGEMSGRTEGGNVERHRGNDASPSRDGVPIIPLDLLRGRRFAYNSLDSMSGILALTRDLEGMGQMLDIFSERIESGAHRASIVAVTEGKADVCAIDCRSWHMAKRHEPKAAEVQVVGWTGMRKGLPMITSRHTPPEIVEKLRDIWSLQEISAQAAGHRADSSTASRSPSR
ncbi:PhnD/SsuA/transferrin family substrate-binding protein [Mesorhizobium sp. BAC0120]|uniref:phosphate/phosphite/phosphonate ABC transporter substrate-binding protein n=1 Tax=Mesorhizobium sp. BAC0120 TaxID=3090670 RepID=UPI00298D53E1|nr:PhnD/SsuA/transferrin family substrate-binding protein [Mesorhizobium sp. BAC0120]MDW6020457.1 PhnD/SsuA/transferrin family substrate-binding protein [Mesorhizobium sp. BAC0120]